MREINFFFFFRRIRFCCPFPFRIDLKALNLTGNWYYSLDGESALCKTASYTGKHKHRKD
jgi:hypothetical protein